jgi:hypothetical protein
VYLCVLLSCRTAEGRKCRLGEGGFGVVYKAVMNGVDEVAVKLVKVRPTCFLVLWCRLDKILIWHWSLLCPVAGSILPT